MSSSHIYSLFMTEFVCHHWSKTACRRGGVKAPAGETKKTRRSACAGSGAGMGVIYPKTRSILIVKSDNQKNAGLIWAIRRAEPLPHVRPPWGHRAGALHASHAYTFVPSSTRVFLRYTRGENVVARENACFSRKRVMETSVLSTQELLYDAIGAPVDASCAGGSVLSGRFIRGGRSLLPGRRL